jgi:hypothetical protein
MNFFRIYLACIEGRKKAKNKNVKKNMKEYPYSNLSSRELYCMRPKIHNNYIKVY